MEKYEEKGPEVLPEKTGIYTPRITPEKPGQLSGGQFNQLNSSDTPIVEKEE